MDLRRFSDVENWIFDLDNTLYPESTNLFTQINEKIQKFVTKFLNISLTEAKKVQAKYNLNYGSTLRGLILEHDIEPEEFLEFVHDVDLSVLAPSESLAVSLKKLPGRKFIMTNGTRKHAENVIDVLGISGYFEDIFGIIEAGMVPKPNPEFYSIFKERNRIDAIRSCVFEDLVRNLTVPYNLGMTTVLIVPEGSSELNQNGWEGTIHNETHIDFISENLSDFLSQIIHSNFVKL